MITKVCSILTACTISICTAVAQTDSIVPSGFDRLDQWTAMCKVERPNALGYPGNYASRLDGFYQWYTANGMENILINNAGDPFAQSGALSSLTFEREVIPAGTMNTATL